MRAQVHAQQGNLVRQGPREARPQLQVLQEQDGDQRRPDPDLQGVGARPHKGFALEVLLQRLEEQLDRPPVLEVEPIVRGSSSMAWISVRLLEGT